ncbi:MAG: hypothetical protein U0271_08505 [Polyangiaceae bacterium]
MGTEHTIELERPTQRRRAILAGLAWMVLAPIAFVAIGKALGPADPAGGGGPPSWLAFALLSLEAAGLLPAAWVYRGARSPAVARCDEHGLTLVVGGVERKIPAEKIRSALVVEGRPSARLELRLDDEEALTLRYSSTQAAQAALSALRLSTQQRAERIPLYNEASRLLNQIGGAVIGAMVSGLPAFMFGASRGPFGVLFAVFTLVPFAIFGASIFSKLLPSITIGADGVAFSTRQDTRLRFVAYRDLDYFSLNQRNINRLPNANVIDLHEKDGTCTQISYFDRTERSLAESVFKRLLEAVAERKDGGGENVAPIAELEDRGESVGEWLARLQKLARRDESYRAEGIDDARVDALVEDGAASPQQRVGAAMLLRIRSPAEGRERIRVASTACADPETRAALLAVAEADADDEALERAAALVRKPTSR